jgi:DNA polymerase-1
MIFIGFDTETYLISPGNPAPKMVCATFANRMPATGIVLEEIFLREEGLRRVREHLLDPKAVLVGANIYYDLGVICAEDPTLVPFVFQAFEEGRIRDVQVRQKLRDIRDGCMKWTLDADGEPTGQRYSLADLEYRYQLADRRTTKKDVNAWRLKYGTLDGVPLDEWPEDAKAYAIEDATGALKVWEKQYGDDEPVHMNGDVLPAIVDMPDMIHDELRQTKYQWALHLMSLWGIRTEGDAVERLQEALEEKAERLLAEVRESVHANTDAFASEEEIEPHQLVDRAGKRKMEAIYSRVTEAYSGNPPLTDTGRPSTDRETLEESGDEALVLLAQYVRTKKMLSKDLKDLRGGVEWPINARWNGLVESGRISCSKPNLANPPREGGVRECFVPRPGRVFIDIDLDTIEMRALAQVNLDLFGFSAMADALREGKDLHSAFAADMIGLAYEDFVRRLEDGDKEVANARQFAKIANFGFMGGMGWRSLIAYAKGYGITVEPELAKKLHAGFKRIWREMPRYFDIIKQWIGNDNKGYVIQRRSNRIRGRLTFCKAANTMFQGLTADATKAAHWELAKATYLAKPGDALYGVRCVLFLYDQFVLEAPEERAAEAAEEVHRIVISTVQQWMPDVPVSGKPSLTRRFYKGPKPIRIEGRLVPSRPVIENKKMRWVADLAA